MPFLKFAEKPLTCEVVAMHNSLKKSSHEGVVFCNAMGKRGASFRDSTLFSSFLAIDVFSYLVGYLEEQMSIYIEIVF